MICWANNFLSLLRETLGILYSIELGIFTENISIYKLLKIDRSSWRMVRRFWSEDYGAPEGEHYILPFSLKHVAPIGAMVQATYMFPLPLRLHGA